MKTMLSQPGPNGTPSVLAQLPKHNADAITGKTFFPELISEPFMEGLRIAFSVSAFMCLVAAAASALRGGKYTYDDDDPDVGQADVVIATEELVSA